MKALHQQLRAITVDGQAARTLLAAVEQTITIGPLLMKLAQQALTIIEGDAERLIQGRHTTRLGLDGMRRGSLPVTGSLEMHRCKRRLRGQVRIPR